MTTKEGISQWAEAQGYTWQPAEEIYLKVSENGIRNRIRLRPQVFYRDVMPSGAGQKWQPRFKGYYKDVTVCPDGTLSGVEMVS